MTETHVFFFLKQERVLIKQTALQAINEELALPTGIEYKI